MPWHDAPISPSAIGVRLAPQRVRDPPLSLTHTHTLTSLALQAERRVAEELAEQMLRQAEALMAEKARVQAENASLQQERQNLLERLEYMEQVKSGGGGGTGGLLCLCVCGWWVGGAVFQRGG